MSIEIPGYKIVRAVGRGGMATVYLAEQEIFEREVALKVMSKSFAEDPSFGHRFFREAKIVSRLVHPNIVTVHDVGEHDGHYYLSMEYIDGGDLKLARKRLTFRQKITAIKDIAKALQYAATKGYVHRDIKPENIMFCISDGRAVLTDFGIARAAEAELSVTQTGVAIGTPHYMSPEQAKGQMVDGRADIYSLGVVLYLLLAGKVPYDAESAVAIGIKHITDPIPLLPVALNSMQPIIDKMMAKSPDKRFQNAASLITALDNLDMELLEQLALEYDRSQRGRENSGEAENETPTLVSSQVRAISRTDSVQVSASQPVVKTKTPPPVAKKRPVENKSKAQTQPQPQVTEINEAVEANTGKQRFTVIYENDVLAGLESGGFPIGRWLAGILIAGAFAGSAYFYFNPDDWRQFVDKTQNVLEQTKVQVGERIDEQDKPKAQEQIPDVAPTKMVEKAKSEGQEIKNPEAEPAVSEEALPEDETVAPSEELTLTEVDPNTEMDVLADGEELAEPLPSEEDLLALAVEEKRARVATLEDAFVNDAAFLPDLVTAHREVLELAPGDVSSGEKLSRLEASEKEKINQLINEKKFTVARKKLSQLQLLFSETDKTDFLKMSASIDHQEQVGGLLKKADQYFSEGNILSPEDGNALAVYKKVLDVDAKNAQALSGIRKVSDYYLRQASEAFANKDIVTAEEKVKVALEVDWKNAKAENLLENIRNLQETLAKNDLLFLQAEQALSNGQYFEPVKANAYHYYALVLQESPEDARALKGVDITMEGFSEWVWALVGDNQFDEAEKALIAPTNMLPREEKLQSLAKTVRAVIKERSITNQPAVTKILVSGKEVNSLTEAQAESISVGRSIYVVFGYENIATNTTLIEARLLDGAGNIEVAKTTIDVVSGNNTVQFKFDSPVGSFPAGLYTLVLTINGTILSSTVFAVE